MGKLRFGRMLDCLCLSCSSATCFCMNALEGEDSMERKALIGSDGVEMMKIKDIMGGNQTLAYQMKPKVCVLPLLYFHDFSLFFICWIYLKFKLTLIDFSENKENKMKTRKPKGHTHLMNYRHSISNPNHPLFPSIDRSLATHSEDL